MIIKKNDWRQTRFTLQTETIHIWFFCQCEQIRLFSVRPAHFLLVLLYHSHVWCFPKMITLIDKDAKKCLSVKVIIWTNAKSSNVSNMSELSNRSCSVNSVQTQSGLWKNETKEENCRRIEPGICLVVKIRPPKINLFHKTFWSWSFFAFF